MSDKPHNDRMIDLLVEGLLQGVYDNVTVGQYGNNIEANSFGGVPSTKTFGMRDMYGDIPAELLRFGDGACACEMQVGFDASHKLWWHLKDGDGNDVMSMTSAGIVEAPNAIMKIDFRSTSATGEISTVLHMAARLLNHQQQ